MTNKIESGPRSALAAAIKVEVEARKSLDDAEAAHARASNRIFDLGAELERLKAAPASSASIADSLIHAHQAGVDVDVELLERPAKAAAGPPASRE